MLKNIFESAIEDLGLPVNILTESILLAIIGAIACEIAYSIVGKNKLRGTEAKIAHWTLRLFIYIGLWSIVYFGIKAYNFIYDNWKIILLSLACIIGTAFIAALSIIIIRFIKKNRTVKNNA